MNASKDLQSLQHTIDTTRTLIDQFMTSLKSGWSKSNASSDAPSPQPLHLLSTAASLLRAQITKLSLLLLNKPFTPTAIDHILRTISSSVLPSLMTAWGLCYRDSFPVLLQEHVKKGLGTIMREIILLLDSIPVNENGIEREIGSRDTLANTGVLWEVCDQMVKIGDDGVGKLALQRAKEYLELFEDAINEMEACVSGESDDFMTSLSDSEEEESEDRREEDVSARMAMKSEALAMFRDIRPCALELPNLLNDFPMLNKQTKINTPNNHGPTLEQTYLLDAIVDILHRLTQDTDELVGALYTNDSAEAEKGMGNLRLIKEQCEHLKPGAWAQADGLSDWSLGILKR